MGEGILSQPILITGATGVLGRALVAAFADAGLPLRQAVRKTANAQPGFEAVRWDYDDPSTFAPALAGAGGLILIAPPLDVTAPAKVAPAVTRAREAGVPRIALISAYGANHEERAPLRMIEHAVIESGVPYAILRPNFFMENFSVGFLAGAIQAAGGIFLAAGDAKTSFISTRDIADAAVAVFRQRLAGVELDLTGPESLDHAEAAALISAAAGRQVFYQALSDEQMSAGARSMGVPEPAVAYLSMLYAVVRAGGMAGVTEDFERVAGRRPTTFQEFAEASASAWK
jgi:uncharacterized protein YbjT (DUF2867 family)